MVLLKGDAFGLRRAFHNAPDVIPSNLAPFVIWSQELFAMLFQEIICAGVGQRVMPGIG